jgi:hypothetical protein
VRALRETRSLSDASPPIEEDVPMHSYWRQMKCLAWVAAFSLILTADAEEKDFVGRMKELGMPMFNGKVRTYYSWGHQQHAEKLQAAVKDMNAFYSERLGVQANVI